MTATLQLVATADPPETGIRNPIHAEEGASSAGYAGALVAGVRTYGWATVGIVGALGEAWLDSGWVDFTLRRPLFAGEPLTLIVEDPAAGEVAHTLTMTKDDGAVVLDGTFGPGAAPWAGELAPPAFAPGGSAPEPKASYTLDDAPVGLPLVPEEVYVKAEAAIRHARDDQDATEARYLEGDRPRLHPSFLAGRMAPLTRHNFTYGPTIHFRSQIQHVGRALAGQSITTGAVIREVYERNGHHYQVLDGSVVGGNDGELARIRHHTIFKPRGT